MSVGFCPFAIATPIPARGTPRGVQAVYGRSTGRRASRHVSESVTRGSDQSPDTAFAASLRRRGRAGSGGDRRPIRARARSRWREGRELLPPRSRRSLPLFARPRRYASACRRGLLPSHSYASRTGPRWPSACNDSTPHSKRDWRRRGTGSSGCSMAARKDPAPASSVFMTVSVEGTIRLFSGSIAHLRIHRRRTPDRRRTAKEELTDWCNTADFNTLRAVLKYIAGHLPEA
jgi:hypothetical protein